MIRRSIGLRAALVLAVALVLVGMGNGRARAASGEGLALRVTCEGFVIRGGSILLDRDNTGAGREQFIITAMDGNGNMILAPEAGVFRVGTRLSFPVGTAFAWTTAPVSNPLVVRIFSPGTETLSEQTIFAAVGTCPTLPTFTPNAFALLSVADGRTSPTVPLNQDPPRPFSGAELVLGQPGYLVVNTGSLNIRSGDGIAYSIVGRVRSGSFLAVLGRNADRSWWYVQVGDIVGWVSNEHVFIRGNLSFAPEVTVQGEPNRPRLITYSRTPLLVAPVAGALRVCDIAGNLEYFVIGRTAGNTWYEIEAVCNDAPVTGWVSADQVAIRNAGALPIPVTD